MCVRACVRLRVCIVEGRWQCITQHRLPPPPSDAPPHPLTLHQHVAACQQLQRLERGAVGPDEALASLCKLVLVAHHATHLDDVALHVIAQNLKGLGEKEEGGG